MLPLRIPTWVPQDSVYLVTNIRVAQSRMPRPRYTRSEEEMIKIGQEAAFSDSFEMRYIINRIIDISLSDKEEKRAESETSLYYFDRYR